MSVIESAGRWIETARSIGVELDAYRGQFMVFFPCDERFEERGRQFEPIREQLDAPGMRDAVITILEQKL